MAFDLGAWLSKGLQQHPPQVMQDVVALALLSSGQPLTELPEPVSKIMGAFFVRAGMIGDADPKQALDVYFAQHPVPTDLVASLQRELQRDPGKPTLRLGAIRG